MFKCEFCLKELNSKKGLKNHIDKFHIDKIQYNFVCKICNKGFEELGNFLSHITKVHKDISAEKYYNENLLGKIRCKYCNEILPYERYSGFFCNQQHYESYNRKNNINYKCEICHVGFETKGGLQQHLGKLHKEINQEEYYKKYLMTKEEINGNCLYCGKQLNFVSFTDGYNKFCYNTECNVKWYNEHTDRKEHAAKSTSLTYQNDKSRLSTHKDYWIKRGYNEEDAIKEISKRQVMFNKEICIKKYGEEKGLEVWQERQNKWLKNFPRQNYSKISQKLFWHIYSLINYKYKEIYFATNENGKKIENKNKELRLKTKHTTRCLDFYIPEIKKCIEFDGTYWHGEIGRGNKMRDKMRDEEILEKGISVLHIKEFDYKNDPEKVIKECLEFLND